jgi:diguanylate cyclase (GGDEF)-like protein
MESIATLLIGAAVLVMTIAAAATLWQLISGLPASKMRTDWYVLLAFIVCFIVGYVYYLVHARENFDEAGDLIAPTMFFMGAAFVALVARIMLRTTRDLLRVSALEAESLTDALTGIHNRRAFDQRWAAELVRARRFNLPITLLILDIDHFKSVNDAHGHAAGDQVLVAVARLITESLRNCDVAARYGGEEFAVIATQTRPDAAIKVAERVRAAVEREARRALGERAADRSITVSIGIAGCDDASQDCHEVFQRADAALYAAKRAGRNRVELGMPPEPPQPAATPAPA